MQPKESSVSRCGRTVEDFKGLLLYNLYHTHGQALQSASKQDAYITLAHTVRDYLVDRWRRTTSASYEANPKFVYYFSLEYLPGKQLAQNMLYTDTTILARKALAAYSAIVVVPDLPAACEVANEFAPNISRSLRPTMKLYCRRSRTPAPSSSARTHRYRSATTTLAPATSCPRAARLGSSGR